MRRLPLAIRSNSRTRS
ncbi:leucine-rich repeat extensin-like protein 2 [Iris pallida]|uniref:Leucine-rich repeat extensin-like protein 2 n=1 Tax=Iris pallida TaxID=29817 RepID=A0AAX6I0C9_IRIPA|nr:leucine-rich repeat extensin-like protein 2 [Iris pallida]